VTDHGDLHSLSVTDVPIPCPSGAPLPFELPGLSQPIQILASDWLADPGNVTAFSFRIPVGQMGMVHNPNAGPAFGPGTLACQALGPNGGFSSQNHQEMYVDYGSGLVGDEPGEVVIVSFPVPEPLMIGSFLDAFFTLAIVNNSPQTILVSGASQDSGEVRRIGDGNVPCAADFNGDGFLDFFDYDEYVSCFEDGTSCPPGRTADFNGDGFVDFFDYDAYVGAFERGC
jgi:hypothetical protein